MGWKTWQSPFVHATLSYGFRTCTMYHSYMPFVPFVHKACIFGTWGMYEKRMYGFLEETRQILA